MNIFILDRDPVIAASYHCNKHCIKMILEQSQMLSTAINVTVPGHTSATYKTTHINHPCSKWIRESSDNYLWGLNLLKALLIEYTNRYGKVHKCAAMVPMFSMYVNRFPAIGLTPFALAMPDAYKSEDAVHAYRLYYAAAKSNIVSWSNGEPAWWSSYRDTVVVNCMEIANDKNDYVRS